MSEKIAQRIAQVKAYQEHAKEAANACIAKFPEAHAVVVIVENKPQDQVVTAACVSAGGSLKKVHATLDMATRTYAKKIAVETANQN